ncbi:serine/threonine protein kinase [Archangium lipolyticum]|uniref:serine/threonine protein kinase n=1 Tax=Archangium lipolyticum TaxID=2970465 RepID=UPI00214A8271|nr:serine/threonine protein kinase [Archangium lipolyticum]
MIMNRAFVLCSAILLGTCWGCATSGGVALRPDGTPGPQECPAKALEAMRILRLHVGDGAMVDLDVNQADVSPIRLYDGPLESMLNDDLGPLESPTRLYGQVWTGGPQVVIRYYEAHPPNGDKIPICAVARLAKGQLKKLPGSVPGMAIVEFSVAGVYVVDSFR